MKVLLAIFLWITSSFAFQAELNEMFNKLQMEDKFDGQKVIAILPFSVGEKVPTEAGRSVAELGVASFQNNGRYKVVDREDFSKVLQEQELAQADIVEDNAQIEVGKILIAERLLTGSVSESFGKRLISAKIIKVETGEVISSGTATVGPASMDDFMKEIMGEKGQVSATLIRSAVFPGWGQLYTNHPIRGGISMTATLGGAGFAIFTWIKTLDALYKSRDSKITNEVTNLLNDKSIEIAANEGRDQGEVYSELLAAAEKKERDTRNDYTELFDKTVIIWAVTGGLYALNLVDATFAGLSSKKKFDLYFSSNYRDNAALKLSFQF